MPDTLEIIELTSICQPDLENLTHLLIAVVEEGASIGFLPPLSKENASAYWKNVMQPGVILWIARSNGRVCGTVQLHLAQKENALHRAEVAKLMVAPERRRSGIGKELMRALEIKARALGRSLLTLDTRSGDASNVLYQSLGYIEAGRIPGYAMSSSGVLDETTIYYKKL